MAIATAIWALNVTPVGAGSVQLSSPMPPSGQVTAWDLSDDQRYVVYKADQTTDNAFELYSAPVAGGPSVRITPLMPVGAAVAFFVITPDSGRVVYGADLDGNGAYELHSVPITGPPEASVQISPALVAARHVTGFGVSSDSARVVYEADLETDDVVELYSVPVTGPASASTRISVPLSGTADVRFFRISPDGSRVVYTADTSTDERFELFSVPIGGPPSATVSLNAPLTPGGSVRPVEFHVTKDSSHVVYRADQDVAGRNELYGVPIAGPAALGIKLNGALAPGGSVHFFGLSDDSTYAVYVADQEVGNRRDVYSAAIAGPPGSGARISPVPVAFGGVVNLRVSADSQWVPYLARQDDATKVELYSVPITGPPTAARKLSGALPALGNVSTWFIPTPDSQYVIYIADQDTDGQDELYSVPIAGPNTEGIKLNGALVTNGDVALLRTSRNSGYVMYEADQLTDEMQEIFTVPVTGPASAGVRLNDPFVAGGDVVDAKLLDHGQAAVYLADQFVNGQTLLFVGGNRAPYVAAPLADVSVPQDAATTTLPLGPTFVDPDGDELTVTAVSSDPSLVAVSIAGGMLALDYQPGRFGIATVTVTAEDPGGLEAEDSFEVTVVATAHTVGLVDSTQGLWHLRDSAGDVTSYYYGNPGDVPFMGDWDCDGDDTPGLFRQSDAYAYLRNSNTVGIADIRFYFGNPDDVPLAGDWDGDGCDTLSIYRPDEQRFYIIDELGENEGGLGAADFSFTFGDPGDKPVVGDWDGDGIDEVGLHRASTGFFYWRNTLDTGVASGEIYFGDPGDRFVAGDWGFVDGVETPAVFRPSDAAFYLRHTLTQGVADSQIVWGEAPWLPVAGHFGLG